MTEVGGDGGGLGFLALAGDAEAVARARLQPDLLVGGVGAAVVEVDVVVIGLWGMAGFLGARSHLISQ